MREQDSARLVAAADPAGLQAAATARRGRGSCGATTRSTREKPGGHKGLGGLSRVLVCRARQGPAPGSGQCCGFRRERFPPDFWKINPALLRLLGLRLQRGCGQRRRTPTALRGKAMGSCAGGCSPAGSCGGRVGGSAGMDSAAAAAAIGLRGLQGLRRDAGTPERDARGMQDAGGMRDAGTLCWDAGEMRDAGTQCWDAGEIQDANMLCWEAGRMQYAGTPCRDAGCRHTVPECGRGAGCRHAVPGCR